MSHKTETSSRKKQPSDAIAERRVTNQRDKIENTKEQLTKIIQRSNDEYLVREKNKTEWMTNTQFLNKNETTIKDKNLSVSFRKQENASNKLQKTQKNENSQNVDTLIQKKLINPAGRDKISKKNNYSHSQKSFYNAKRLTDSDIQDKKQKQYGKSDDIFLKMHNDNATTNSNDIKITTDIQPSEKNYLQKKNCNINFIDGNWNYRNSQLRSAKIDFINNQARVKKAQDKRTLEVRNCREITAQLDKEYKKQYGERKNRTKKQPEKTYTNEKTHNCFIKSLCYSSQKLKQKNNTTQINTRSTRTIGNTENDNAESEEEINLSHTKINKSKHNLNKQPRIHQSTQTERLRLFIEKAHFFESMINLFKKTKRKLKNERQVSYTIIGGKKHYGSDIKESEIHSGDPLFMNIILNHERRGDDSETENTDELEKLSVIELSLVPNYSYERVVAAENTQRSHSNRYQLNREDQSEKASSCKSNETFIITTDKKSNESNKYLQEKNKKVITEKNEREDNKHQIRNKLTANNKNKRDNKNNSIPKSQNSTKLNNSTKRGSFYKLISTTKIYLSNHEDKKQKVTFKKTISPGSLCKETNHTKILESTYSHLRKNSPISNTNYKRCPENNNTDTSNNGTSYNTNNKEFIHKNKSLVKSINNKNLKTNEMKSQKFNDNTQYNNKSQKFNDKAQYVTPTNKNKSAVKNTNNIVKYNNVQKRKQQNTNDFLSAGTKFKNRTKSTDSKDFNEDNNNNKKEILICKVLRRKFVTGNKMLPQLYYRLHTEEYLTKKILFEPVSDYSRNNDHLEQKTDLDMSLKYRQLNVGKNNNLVYKLMEDEDAVKTNTDETEIHLNKNYTDNGKNQYLIQRPDRSSLFFYWYVPNNKKNVQNIKSKTDLHTVLEHEKSSNVNNKKEGMVLGNYRPEQKSLSKRDISLINKEICNILENIPVICALPKTSSTLSDTVEDEDQMEENLNENDDEQHQSINTNSKNVITKEICNLVDNAIGTTNITKTNKMKPNKTALVTAITSNRISENNYTINIIMTNANKNKTTINNKSESPIEQQNNKKSNKNRTKNIKSGKSTQKLCEDIKMNSERLRLAQTMKKLSESRKNILCVNKINKIDNNNNKTTTKTELYSKENKLCKQVHSFNRTKVEQVECYDNTQDKSYTHEDESISSNSTKNSDDENLVVNEIDNCGILLNSADKYINPKRQSSCYKKITHVTKKSFKPSHDNLCWKGIKYHQIEILDSDPIPDKKKGIIQVIKSWFI